VTARRSLRSGILAKVAAHAGIAVGTGLISIVVGRALGPSVAGAYAVAVTYLAALIVIASLGFESGIAFLVSRLRWAPRRAFAASQVLAVGLGIPFAAAAYGVYWLFGGAFAGVDDTLMLVTLAALPFALSWMVGCAVPLALDRYEAHATPVAGQAMLGLALTIPFAIVDGLRGAVIAWSASHIITAVVYGVYLYRTLPHTEPAESPHPVREALRFGALTYVNTVLQFLSYRVQIFILTAFVGESAEVGHYSVAASVVTALSMIPWAVSSVLLPRVASLSGDQLGEESAGVEGKALRHTVLVLVASAVILVPVLLIAVPIVYGEEFQEAALLAILLLPGIVCVGIGSVLVSATAGRGHPRYAMVNGIIATPLAIVLYVVFIDAYGATGAAIASTLAYIVSFVLAAFFYRRATGIPLSVLVPGKDELTEYRTAAVDIKRLLRARIS
jgi:O-antigen/teichoic acid export membrane protein